MIRIFIISFLLLLGGCSSSAKPRSEYRLVLHPYPQTREYIGGCRDMTLSVADALGSSAYMSRAMYYKAADNEQNHFNDSLWAEPLHQLITELFSAMASRTGLYASVVGVRSRAKGDRILEIEIEEFIQHFDASYASAHAKISLRLTLLESKSGKVIAQKRFEIIKESPTLDAKGGVVSLESGLNELLRASHTWLKESCR